MTNSRNSLPKRLLPRRIWRISAGAMIVLVLLAIAALARPPQATDFVLEGKITRKAGDKLTINTGQNMLFTVRYTAKTEMMKSDGSAASPGDLQVGIRIRVEGELTESGEVLAARIKLQQ